jgi:hypothetical protein
MTTVSKRVPVAVTPRPARTWVGRVSGNSAVMNSSAAGTDGQDVEGAVRRGDEAVQARPDVVGQRRHAGLLLEAGVVSVNHYRAQ